MDWEYHTGTGITPAVSVGTKRGSFGMSDSESCNLPNYCTCKQCQWWGENGWDASRTPDWQMPKDEDSDEGY